MIANNDLQNRLVIEIPLSGAAELFKYKAALIGILSKIEITNCDPELRQHIKNVYELLSHLQCDEEFLSQHSELRKEENELHKNILA